MSLFMESIHDLTDAQMKFICEETSMAMDEIYGLSEDDLYYKVYDIMCDIEMAEIPADDEPLSERCEIASDIVTVMGNALAQDEGYWDED